MSPLLNPVKQSIRLLNDKQLVKAMLEGDDAIACHSGENCEHRTQVHQTNCLGQSSNPEQQLGSWMLALQASHL